jgi:hypothetical protein
MASGDHRGKACKNEQRDGEAKRKRRRVSITACAHGSTPKDKKCVVCVVMDRDLARGVLLRLTRAKMIRRLHSARKPPYPRLGKSSAPVHLVNAVPDNWLIYGKVVRIKGVPSIQPNRSFRALLRKDLQAQNRAPFDTAHLS